MGRRSDVEITRRGIGQAALAILDERGVEALTVRAIAERLGVRPPSLYNHVGSKDEMLDAVTELLDEAIDRTPLDDPDWRRGLVAFARSYRNTFRAHPAALIAIVRRPVETRPALATYDALLRLLHRAGFDPAGALKVAAVVDYLVLGSALLPFTGGFTRRPSEYADGYPDLAAALMTAELPTADEAAFELGLGILVDALASDLQRLPA